MREETRNYPTCCQSAACGKCGDECNQECKYWNKLQEFEHWRKRTEATQPDPVFCPWWYMATKPDQLREQMHRETRRIYDAGKMDNVTALLLVEGRTGCHWLEWGGLRMEPSFAHGERIDIEPLAEWLAKCIDKPLMHVKRGGK